MLAKRSGFTGVRDRGAEPSFFIGDAEVVECSLRIGRYVRIRANTLQVRFLIKFFRPLVRFLTE